MQPPPPSPSSHSFSVRHRPASLAPTLVLTLALVPACAFEVEVALSATEGLTTGSTGDLGEPTEMTATDTAAETAVTTTGDDSTTTGDDPSASATDGPTTTTGDDSTTTDGDDPPVVLNRLISCPNKHVYKRGYDRIERHLYSATWLSGQVIWLRPPAEGRPRGREISSIIVRLGRPEGLCANRAPLRSPGASWRSDICGSHLQSVFYWTGGRLQAGRQSASDIRAGWPARRKN